MVRTKPAKGGGGVKLQRTKPPEPHIDIENMRLLYPLNYPYHDAKYGRYRLDVHPVMARWLAAHGATDKQIAEEFGITEQTLYNWKKRYPEFAQALAEGKHGPNKLVERSLFARALGYFYDEVKTIEIDGEVVRRERTRKHALPDVNAQLMWLRNRTKEWREEQTVELKGSVAVELTDVRREIEERLKAISARFGTNGHTDHATVE